MSDEFIQAITDAIEEITGGTAIEFPEPVDQGDPATRQQIADHVAAHPHQYKVCCGCEGIIRERAAVCPQCNAYRFETDKELIIQQAKHLATRVPDYWVY